MNQAIEIPLSKGKIFLGIGASILFVMLGIYFLSNSDTLDYNKALLQIVGIASILFFGAAGIYGTIKLFDKKPGLIIDDRGLTDNSSAVSIGFIDWSDITEIRRMQVMSTKFLLINVQDPEVYLKKAKSGMQRKLMQANLKSYGTPISITSSTLGYDFGKLENIIKEKFQEHNSGKKNKD